MQKSRASIEARLFLLYKLMMQVNDLCYLGRLFHGSYHSVVIGKVFAQFYVAVAQ